MSTSDVVLAVYLSIGAVPALSCFAMGVIGAFGSDDTAGILIPVSLLVVIAWPIFLVLFLIDNPFR